MRYLVVLTCVIAAAIADEKYTDKYDNIDIQEILDNKRLLHSYIDCIMDRGKCTPEGKELKGKKLWTLNCCAFLVSFFGILPKNVIIL